jgi:hypothetical protein
MYLGLAILIFYGSLSCVLSTLSTTQYFLQLYLYFTCGMPSFWFETNDSIKVFSGDQTGENGVNP